MSFRQQAVLELPPRLHQLASQDHTKWYVLQILDMKMDWRAALTGAKLQLDGPKSVLQAPIGGEGGLGVLVDEEAAPPHMLVLKDQGEQAIAAGRVSACIKVGNLLPKNSVGSTDAKCVTLKPIERQDYGFDVPLVYWRLGPSIPEDGILASLAFPKEAKTNKNGISEIKGGFAEAPQMQLLGRTKQGYEARYLVGGIAEGSKSMYIYEAQVYWVERDGEFGRNRAEELAQEALDAKAGSFKDQRGDLIKLSGAAKKKRQLASKELQTIDESKVANMDECMTQLNTIAENFQDMDAIKEKDAMQLREELLPPFDKLAIESPKIYAKGLEKMFPKRLLEQESRLLDDRMTVMLQQPSRILASTHKDLTDVFKSHFGARLAFARAEAMSAESCDAAVLTSRRFIALNLLIKLYKERKQRYKFAEFVEALMGEGKGGKGREKGQWEAKDGSKFLQHLFEYFLQESPMDRRVRQLHKKKLMCHIIVLVLDLSVQYKLDMQPLMEELNMEIGEIEQNLRYVGCEVNKKYSDRSADTKSATLSLVTELKAPLSFQMAKGAGKSRKRKA